MCQSKETIPYIFEWQKIKYSFESDNNQLLASKTKCHILSLGTRVTEKEVVMNVLQISGSKC